MKADAFPACGSMCFADQESNWRAALRPITTGSCSHPEVAAFFQCCIYTNDWLKAYVVDTDQLKPPCSQLFSKSFSKGGRYIHTK